MRFTGRRLRHVTPQELRPQFHNQRKSGEREKNLFVFLSFFLVFKYPGTVPYIFWHPLLTPDSLWPFTQCEVFIYLFIYLFIYFFSCAGSLFLLRLFSSCSEQGLLSSCGARAPYCRGFSCRALALGAQVSVVAARESIVVAQGL